MKKILFLLFLIPIISHAQNCISGNDQKTGKSIQSGVTFLNDTVKNTAGVISFMKFSDKAFISFNNMFIVKTINYNTDKLILIVKFGNGDTKKFIANTDTRILPLPNGIMVGFTADITNDDISYFKANPSVNFKISYKDDEANGYNTEIDKDVANNIIKSLACIVPSTVPMPNCISTIDKRTGKPMKSGITLLKGATSFPGTVKFTRYDSDKFFDFTRDFVLKEPLKEPMDAEKLALQIKFSNGEIKKFETDPMSIILPSPDGELINMRIDLTDADIAYFKQNPMLLITLIDRSDESKQYVTPITADQANTIINSINCIQ